MALTTQAQPTFERRLRSFLEARGSDLDAMSAMFLLFRANTDTVAAMETVALRPLGLTHAGFVLLMTLWTMGPQETRQLARVQRVSRPSIVSSVDTLERAGLVRRIRSTVDRRLVTVELTGAGEATIRRAQQDWHDCERQIAGVLTQDEQRVFADLLRRLMAAAQEGCAAVRSPAPAEERPEAIRRP